MIKRFEIKYYAPTETKGDRIRVKGLTNSYFTYNYKFNDSIEQGLSILNSCGYSEEQINKIIPTKTGAIIIAERW